MERRLVLAALGSNFLNDGPLTARFERRLAKLLGVRHVVAVTSGTSALFVSLAALGIGPGDEVLVPDVTFIATANAVSLAGAEPVLVDVAPRTLTIAPAAARRLVTRRTKAIIPMHLSGRAADMKALARIASAHRLAVVEDAAEALGSKLGGRFLGTFGDAGCFSFTANKIITSGQGGAIATDDDALHRRLREVKDQGRPKRGTGGADEHVSIGYNFKYTDLQAAVALGQLGRLRGRNRRMRELREAYGRGLAGIRGIRPLPFQAGASPEWVDALAEDRDGLIGFLADHGVECREFWHPLHSQRPYARPDAWFPVSARLVPQAFWLPSSFMMKDSDIARVCRLVRGYLA